MPGVRAAAHCCRALSSAWRLLPPNSGAQVELRLTREHGEQTAALRRELEARCADADARADAARSSTEKLRSGPSTPPRPASNSTQFP